MSTSIDALGKLLIVVKPPYEELKKDNGSLKRDKLKFEEILRRYEERKQKWMRQVQDEKTELEYNCTLSSFLQCSAELTVHAQWRIWRSCMQKSSD